MHLELDYERFSEEEYEIARILTSKQVSELFDKLVMPVQKQHDQLPLSATKEERAASVQAVNKAQDEFDIERLQIWNQAAALYCDIRDGKVNMASKCPEGFKLVSQRMDIGTLRVLNFYPGERMVEGIAAASSQYLGVPDDKLLVEVRPKESNLSLLYPSPIYFVSALHDKEGMSSENVELVNFIYSHPNIVGGIMEADLQDEACFLENLYVEGVPMSQVKEILLQQPYITQDNLRQIRQLYRIKAEGAAVVEKNIDLKGVARQAAEKVTEDFRHMYVGPDRPLDGHPYYTEDIRYKFDAALKQQAELQLRKLGVIATLPESLDVKWKNTRGDYWEAEQMTHIMNDMFRGYAEKIVDAEQNSDWMRVNIYSSNPEYRQRIMDALTHSWAKEQIVPVTDLQDMPQLIADARCAEMQRRESALDSSIIGFDTVYFFEKGVPGYVRVDSDRTITAHGEPLTESHMAYIHDLAAHANLLRSNTPVFNLIGPERLFLDKHAGNLIRTSEETVNDEKVLINKDGYNVFDSASARYQEITGRITDAKVVSNGDNHILRCKIDGVQQSGRKLSPYSTHLPFIGDKQYVENLAVRYFGEALLDSGQEQNRGRGR